MKTFLYMVCCGLVISVAYWAYKENYRTQASLRRVADLQQKIAAEREAISVLSAEWAYLNRPERLREMITMNFDQMQLLPLMPEHFAEVELVSYPSLSVTLDDLSDPISVRSGGAGPDKEFP